MEQISVGFWRRFQALSLCFFKRLASTARKVARGVFTSHVNPKYFLFHSLHRIFGRMHGALNVGKKDN
jgi:hypothetical protein